MTSVFAGLDEPQEVKSIIINSLLSHVRCLLLSRDEHYILNTVSAKYELPVVLAARKILFEWHEPEKRYGYNGPHNARIEKQKVLEATKGIIEKMKGLDCRGEMPMILCPSDELHKIVPMLDDDPMSARLTKIEHDITELKTMAAFVPHPITSLPHHMTENRNAYRNPKRVRMMEEPSNVSDNVSTIPAVITGDSDAESVSSQVSESFIIPRYNRKIMNRNARAAAQGDKISGDVSQRTMSRRMQTVWGNGEEGPADGSELSGPPPDIFIHNCRSNVSHDSVGSHFTACGIHVVEIKKVSHPEATRQSFVMTVGTQKDYNIVMEGKIVPTGIGVRRYFPPRRNFQGGTFDNASSGASNTSAQMDTQISNTELISKVDLTIAAAHAAKEKHG